jgi:GNAT superfamily N-acetyltransferase
VDLTDLPVRRLDLPDLPGLAALSADRGWEPALEKWRLLFEFGEVYGVDDPAGGLAGAVALTRYPPELAAIGKMLVATRHERQGLGRRLMTHVLDRAPEPAVCLIATAYGRPLYERLGFRAVDGSSRMLGSGHNLYSKRDTRPAEDADQPAIAALDQKAFGADRVGLLKRLSEVAERVVVVAGPGGLEGFAASWAPAGAGEPRFIGPVVGLSADVAMALISALAAGSDAPVRLDLPARHAGVHEWLAGHGLAEVRQSTWMVRGGDLPGLRGQVFAPVNLAMC